MDDLSTARPGPDGLLRCPWSIEGAELDRHYHDTEWGHAVTDEQGLYERLMLEANQSGLSWSLILRRRPGMREAYAGFDPDAVARFGDADVARLLADARVIRNRRKVEAAITNARAVVALREHGGLPDLLWSFQPEAGPAPRTVGEVPSTTPESIACAKALKKAGFVFVGPTTCHAMMEAVGMVNDHLADCAFRKRVS